MADPLYSLMPLAAPLLLTVTRCCGMVWTAPLLGSPVVPPRLRFGIAVVLGICGAIATWSPALPVLHDWSQLVWLAPLEFLLGAVLGGSVRLLLSGLELAAGLIDQQAGLMPFAATQPGGSEATSASGSWLIVLGGLTWLTLAPLGGDLRLIAAWLDTLRTIPPGSLTDIESPVRLLQDVVLSALVLGLQVAAPLVVTAGLLQSLWAVLARSRGGGLWQPPLTSARILLCLLVLALTTTELGSRLSSGMDGLLRGVTAALSPPDSGGAG